jgi:hypothetical protein
MIAIKHTWDGGDEDMKWENYVPYVVCALHYISTYRYTVGK